VIPQGCLLSSVLQTTEHSDSVGGCGSVEWHWQMLYKPRPIHQPAWISRLEEDEASTSQIPWQRTAYQVGHSVSPLPKETVPCACTFLRCSSKAPCFVGAHQLLQEVLIPHYWAVAILPGMGRSIGQSLWTPGKPKHLPLGQFLSEKLI
jgi:hypothetical protein